MKQVFILSENREKEQKLWVVKEKKCLWSRKHLDLIPCFFTIKHVTLDKLQFFWASTF